jgi:hypothetical protein
MLKRILTQMQFMNEGTGGGCNAMTLYKDGHVIVVTIDAMTDFELVRPDLAIDVNIYRTVTQYEWGINEPVKHYEAFTQSEAILHVIDALDFIAVQHSHHCADSADALAKVWTLIEQRHGIEDVCAMEVTTDHIHRDFMPEVNAFITLWDALTQ